MYLSMDILREELSGNFSVVESRERAISPLNLTNAAFLTSKTPEPDILYLAEARRLPTKWRFEVPCSLVVVGNVDPGYFGSAPVHWIQVNDNHFPQVFNFVLSVFHKYATLDDGLQTAVIHHASPEVVCDSIAKLLDSPMLVFDKALRLQYCSTDAAPLFEWEQDAFSGLQMLPTEFINQLNLVYTETADNFVDGTVLLRDDRLPYNLICTFNGKNNYIMVVLETRRRLTVRDLQVASHLNRYILLSFEKAARKGGTGGIVPLVVSMLDGKRFSAEELKNQLNNVGWKPDDDCCVIVVHPLSEQQSLQFSNTFCLKLENQFKSCVAFPYYEKAVAVVNLRQSGCKVEEIPHRIGILLRDGLLKAGISFMFWAFEHIPICYQQACSAHDMGNLYDPSRWCYLFEDYALKHFMHYGSSVIPPRHLCHPALVLLHLYDLENDSQLRKTLETYLACNCNAVTAANQLFIHRNTFYQRLNKIMELVNVNLEDPNVRLYLQLSDYLISMYYYELENGYRFPQE